MRRPWRRAASSTACGSGRRAGAISLGLGRELARGTPGSPCSFVAQTAVMSTTNSGRMSATSVVLSGVDRASPGGTAGPGRGGSSSQPREERRVVDDAAGGGVVGMALLPVLEQHDARPQPPEHAHQRRPSGRAAPSGRCPAAGASRGARRRGSAPPPRPRRPASRACRGVPLSPRVRSTIATRRPRRDLARQRAAHDDLGVVGMRADRGDVEGIHVSAPAPGCRRPRTG